MSLRRAAPLLLRRVHTVGWDQCWRRRFHRCSSRRRCARRRASKVCGLCLNWCRPCGASCGATDSACEDSASLALSLATSGSGLVPRCPASLQSCVPVVRPSLPTLRLSCVAAHPLSHDTVVCECSECWCMRPCTVRQPSGGWNLAWRRRKRSQGRQIRAPLSERAGKLAWRPSEPGLPFAVH